MSEILSLNKGHLKSKLKELDKIYKEFRGEVFDDAIFFKAELTVQLNNDLHMLFIDRDWYTGEFVEKLSDDDQEAVDYMLDGYDKLTGDIIYDDLYVMMGYNFLLTVKQLQAVIKDPDQFENSVDELQTEIDHLNCIRKGIQDLLKKQ